MSGTGVRVERATTLELILYIMLKGGETAKVFFEAEDAEILDFISEVPVVEFIVPV